jgi:hypothetical protein
MKEFQTLFSINGAIKPGFKSAFGGARKEIINLGTSVEKVVPKVGKLTKALVGIGAAYLGYKGLQTFFSDAAANASKASDANFRLLQTLRNQSRLQVSGTANYQNQFKILQQQTRELAKVGVFSSTSYANAQRQLSAYGLMPKQIAQITQKLGDVTVAQKGASATMEDMEEAARQVGDWIIRGNVRGLGPMAGLLTENEKKLAKNWSQAERLNKWLELAAKSAKDFNKEAGDTSPVQRFRKEWEEFSKDIGERLGPAKSAVATFKSEALAAFGPEIKRVIDEDLNPAIQRMTDYLKKDGVQSVKDFAKSFKSDIYPEVKRLQREFGNLSRTIGSAFGVESQDEAKSLGTAIAEWITWEIKETIEMIKGLERLLAGMVETWKTLTAGGTGQGVYTGPPAAYTESIGGGPPAATEEGRVEQAARQMRHMQTRPVTAGQREAMQRRAEVVEAVTGGEAAQAATSLESAIEAMLKSEGYHPGYKQGGISELYGFRAHEKTGYAQIKAAAEQGGEPAARAVATKLLAQRGRRAGAEQFVDPGVQAAVTSLAHMRGEAGAQAIMNSVAGAPISKTGKLTPAAIETINQMSPEEVQARIREVRTAYDDKIYGGTYTSTSTGKSGSWRDVYGLFKKGGGLFKRYAKEEKQFAELSKSAAVAAEEPEEMQAGGIVSSPTMAMIGEAGPEAVLPLNEPAKLLGLLGKVLDFKSLGQTLGSPASLQSIGPGTALDFGNALQELWYKTGVMKRPGGEVSRGPMNYAPTLNIGSGAEPGMVSLARNMLRDTADEFFERYDEAFEEDRRLAFE